MNLLAIDTSTEYLSLAAARDDEVFSIHAITGQRQAEAVFEAVRAVLGQAELQLSDLDGIVFGCGPGSFTGLRVACGVTQGLAYALGIPVKGIITLEALAEEAHRACAAERVIACIDARMGEVYHAAYRREGERWSEVSPPGLFQPDSVPQLSGSGWAACGSGFLVHAPVLRARYPWLSILRPDLEPTASAALRLARPAFEAGQGEPADAALPLYLRDKVALKKGEQAR